MIKKCNSATLSREQSKEMEIPKKII